MKRPYIIPIRKKLRRGQPNADEKEALRLAVYERARGRCELKLSSSCKDIPLAWDGPDPWSHGHLVHLKAKRRYGWGLDNLAWGCAHCHLVELHNPKPCPPKPKMEGVA